MDQTETSTERVEREKPEKTDAVNIVPIDEKGLLTFSSQIELGRAASIAIQLELAPDHLRKEGRAAVGAAMILCKQYNLPQKAMNQMAWIKGKLTCFGSLVTALAERHPMYGEKQEFFVDEVGEKICSANKNLKAKPWAAVVQIKKRESDVWTEYYFTYDDVEVAGLAKNAKPESAWSRYFRDMMMHKARSRALRSEYASALEGIDYHEDQMDSWSSLKDVTHTGAADELNEKYA
jgi:hypothetical protein